MGENSPHSRYQLSGMMQRTIEGVMKRYYLMDVGSVRWGLDEAFSSTSASGGNRTPIMMLLVRHGWIVLCLSIFLRFSPMEPFPNAKKIILGLTPSTAPTRRWECMDHFAMQIHASCWIRMLRPSLAYTSYTAQ